MSSNDEECIDYELLFKIIIVGESCVGKTNIISRYLNDEFKYDVMNTLGVELGTKYLKIKEKKAKLQIWDTAGQERFHSIISSYFKGAHGCFIVYDITSETSFNKVDNWFEESKRNADKDVSIIIVGNKCDLEEDRVITKEMGEEKAKNFNCPFFETSAKSKVNINEIFQEMLDDIYDKIGKQKMEENNDNNVKKSDNETIDIEPKQKEEKKGCC